LIFPAQLLGVQVLEGLVVNAGDGVTVSEHFLAGIVLS